MAGLRELFLRRSGAWRSGMGRHHVLIAAVIENGTYFSSKLFESEWLLQEIVFNAHDFVVEHRLPCVTGHKQNTGFRTNRSQLRGELPSAEIGHDYIGHREVNRRAVGVGDGERMAAISCFQHSVTAKA